MPIAIVHVLVGGMINLIGQLGAEVITHSASILREFLRKTFGEEYVKYADTISILLSIMIVFLIIYYILDVLNSKHI